MILQALRLARAVATRRLSLYGGHAKVRAAHVVLLAIFGLGALVFLLVLATVALARRVGTLEALGIMAGVFAFGAIVVLLLMRSEARAHALRMERQAQEDQRMLQAALISAAPTAVRGGGGIAVAAAGLLAGLTLFRRGRRQRGRDRPRDDRS